MKHNQVLIQESSFEKARKKIRENKGKEVIFSSNDDDLNRKILEKENINTLLLNLSERKDQMKQRDSGFNHILAKIAKKNNVKIGINFEEIINSNKREKPFILGRIRQNIMLCKKNKLNMRFISPSGNKKDERDLKALGLVLGMPTWMIKNV